MVGSIIDLWFKLVGIFPYVPTKFKVKKSTIKNAHFFKIAMENQMLLFSFIGSAFLRSSGR